MTAKSRARTLSVDDSLLPDLNDAELPLDDQPAEAEPPAEAEQEEEPSPEESAQQKERPKCTLTTGEALDLVKLEMGPLNWTIFEAEKFEMHNAGNGGVE